MPKELLIMRHAKSSWDDDSMTDHERPLNPRGLRDAPRMAQFLNANKLVPDLIVSSDANRARSTANLISEHLNADQLQVEVIEDFYLAAPDVYLEYAQRLSDQYERPMFVGHNPGMEGLVNSLAGGQWENMPTAAVAHAVFEFDMWNEFTADAAIRSLDVYRPKQVLHL